MVYGYGQFEGLSFVGGLELDYEQWQFYEVGVWEDENGGLYISTDSGCSCPTPWENHTRDDLTGPLTEEEAIEEITSLWDNARDNDDYYHRSVQPEWLDNFLAEVRDR